MGGAKEGLSVCGAPYLPTPGRTETYTHTHREAERGHKMGFLQVLPVFVFAYSCHQNFPMLVEELREPTPRRVTTTIAGK
jgi:amino acid permease